MTVITILISVIFSAGIVVVLRSIDRENNSLEKVKRYADKRQGELDQYFNEQAKMLTGASAELKTQQTQAFASIKRIAKEMEGYREMIVGIQKDKAAAESIQQKIIEYGKEINALS